jgi:hypothetical protein
MKYGLQALPKLGNANSIQDHDVNAISLQTLIQITWEIAMVSSLLAISSLFLVCGIIHNWMLATMFKQPKSQPKPSTT